MDAFQTSIKNFIKKYTVAIEISLLLISSFSIISFYYEALNSSLLLILTLNLAAIFYFMVAAIEKRNGLPFYAYKVTNIGCSMTILGTMFKLLDYPGSALMLKAGVISMSVALLVYVFYQRGTWSILLTVIVVRVAMLTSLGLIVWLLL